MTIRLKLRIKEHLRVRNGLRIRLKLRIKEHLRVRNGLSWIFDLL